MAFAATGSGVTTVGDLDGNFKEVYADKLVDLRPRSLRFLTDIKYLPKDKSPGNSYHQPVQLQHEHGFTYAGKDAGAFELNEPIVGATKDATVVGFQTLLRSRMDYETAARASSAGQRAFVQATKLMTREMTLGFRKRCELDMINGRQGIGEVKAVGDNFVEIEPKAWIPGAWAGAEGAEVEFWDGATYTGDGTADDGRSPGDDTANTVTAAVITKVDFTSKKIYFDASQFDVDDGTDGVEVGDKVFFKGARAATGEWKIPPGIRDILLLGSAGSGSLFGIDVGNYSLWQAHKHEIPGDGAALDFAAVNKAIVGTVNKGLEENVCLYITPNTWADLISEEAVQRRWPSHNGDRYKVGAEDIEFYSQHGTVKIKTSLYMPESEGIMIAPQLWNIVGATDMTFNLPGRGDSFFLHTPENAGFELRAYKNSACFTEAPGKSTLITNIVNSL